MGCRKSRGDLYRCFERFRKDLYVLFLFFSLKIHVMLPILWIAYRRDIYFWFPIQSIRSIKPLPLTFPPKRNFGATHHSAYQILLAVDAVFGEILTTLEKLRWTMNNGEQYLRPEYRSVGPMTIHKHARVEYVPYGLMGCIVSWNYPFHNAIGPVISALMAGSACVVKCSEWVAWSSKYWESIIKNALKAHGLDEDLVSFVNGYVEAGEALIDAADKVCFLFIVWKLIPLSQTLNLQFLDYIHWLPWSW